MAAAAKVSTDPRARSLELARARGETVCSWHAREIGHTRDERTGELVSVAWWVDSASSEAEYVVTYTARDDRAQCQCPAAQYGRPCHHAGLGLMKGRYLAALYSPAGQAEAERQAARDLAHEGNARALGY